MASNGNGWRGIFALIGAGVAMFAIFTTVNLVVTGQWIEATEARAADREIRIRVVEADINKAGVWRDNTTRRLEEIRAEVKAVQMDLKELQKPKP